MGTRTFKPLWLKNVNNIGCSLLDNNNNNNNYNALDPDFEPMLATGYAT